MRIFVKRSRLCLFLLIILVAACGHSSGPVHQLSAGGPHPTQSDSKVQKVSDVPNGTGWRTLQFINGHVAWLGSSEYLWRTVNEGKEWHRVYSANSYEDQIRTFQFVDENVGFMERFAGLYRTEDSGQTWTKIPTPFDDGKGDLGVISFVKGATAGWAAGGMFRRISPKESQVGVPNSTFNSATNKVLDGAVFRTDDGGRSWKQEPLSISAGRFHDIYTKDDTQLFVLGDAVFYTNNGGQQWTPIEFNAACVDQRYLEDYEGDAIDIYFVDSKVGWLSFNDGRIAKSTDGGRTWCDLLHPGSIDFALPFDRYLKEIHFVDSEHGWGLGGDRFLYETKNGGTSWQRAVTDIKFDDMNFLNLKQGWLIGEKGLFVIRTHP